MPRFSLLLTLLCLPWIVGCEGCRQSSDDKDKENEEQAPQEDFTSRPPRAFPADDTIVAGGIKPGHWLSASQALRSNKVDSRGDLIARSAASGMQFRSGDEKHVTGVMSSQRPVVLPKGQMRRFDFRILPASPNSNDQNQCLLGSRFVSNGRSVYFDVGMQPYRALAASEYFFVVLTSRPQRFAKFKDADWLKPYQSEVEFQRLPANYRLIIPPTDELLRLAETMLDWTSTAVLLWDDLSPDALTPDQQTAIADWVRFGGQLIVNGADASDAVSKSSLSDLLPLLPTGNIELDPDGGEELLSRWQVKTDKSTDKQISLLRSQSSRVAIDGKMADDAIALPNSGNLVLSRQIGRGRVIQTRFDITSDWIIDWQSYQSFVNAALLDRPPRRYLASKDSLIQHRYAGTNVTTANASMNTRFQLAARDAVLPTPVAGKKQSKGNTPLTFEDSVSGIGGWTDDSAMIGMARAVLRSESGIEIPKSSLVVKSLGWYLLILVPVNYLIFRLLGKLEYAWLAVPLIAIIGAVWVARAARLDIGFARSQTEIATLELQPNYARGHLTRIVAIYNSLSSSYDVSLNTIDGCALPIATSSSNESGQAIFRTSYEEGPSLAEVAVGSNQVRMIHAEQIVDVGGSISISEDGEQVINRTNLELFDVVVVDKSTVGTVRVAIVGGCQADSATSLRYRDIEAAPIDGDLPMQSAKMLTRLASPAAMPSGTTRLVARVDTSLPGMKITPTANQLSAQTIVLAHLKHPLRPVTKSDLNLIYDVKRTPTYQDKDIDSDSDKENTP